MSLESRGKSAYASLMAIALAFTQPGWAADDCKEVDLNASPGSPFRTTIPVYDQDGTGTCFAHAAATVIDYYRVKHKGANTNTLTSPVWAAWGANYKARTFITEVNTDGGFFWQVVGALEKIGNCPRTTVARALKQAAGEDYSETQFVHFLDKIYEIATTYPNNFKHGISAGTYNRIFRTDNFLPHCSVESISTTLFVLEMQEVLGLTSNQVLDSLFKDNCVQTAAIEKYPARIERNDRSDASLGTWVERLLLGDSPVEFDLCSSVFDDLKYTGVKVSLLDGRRMTGVKKAEDCGPHAVVITAKKKVAGKCSYLVRNSWGKLWQGKAALDCACMTADGQYYPECNSRPFSDSPVESYLGCWYPADRLLANTQSINGFEPIPAASSNNAPGPVPVPLPAPPKTNGDRKSR